MQNLDRFKSILKTFPEDSVRGLLDGQMARRCGDLLDVYLDRLAPLADRRQAVRSLAVTAIAQHGLNNPTHVIKPYYATPEWLGVARLRIAEYAGKDPIKRNVLMNTIFFTDEQRTLRDLDIVASASAVPWDDYDPLSFAAGVASGMIKSRDPCSADAS